jgi:hypothetical protein
MAHRRQKESAVGAKGARPTKADRSPFVTYRPTKEDGAAAIQHCEQDGLAATLERVLDSTNTKISLSPTKSGDAYAASASEWGAEYGKGKVLTVFHTDPIKALMGLLYALEVVYTQFPHDTGEGQHVFDW